MVYTREERQAISKLWSGEADTYGFLEELEASTLREIPELCRILQKPKIHFVGISCATGTEDEKNLNVANSVGFFSRVIRQRAETLLGGFESRGKEVCLTLFVQDLEFVRAWEWTSRSHEDLKLEAWFQIEMAKEAEKAPPGEIVFWSDVEPRALQEGCISWDQALQWAAQPEQRRALDEDIRYRLSIPKLKNARRSDLEPSSHKRVADYAMVGEALELLYPDAIFVQAADARTDHLLGLRRKNPLPIIHPWR